MALSAGTVTAASDGTPTGSGLSLALYNARKGPIDTRLASAGVSPTGDFWSGIAEQATADASALVSYITANAAVTVTIHTTDSSLQRTPNPNNADTNTQGPSANKNLSGTVA